MYKFINSAEDVEDTRLSDSSSTLKDEFDYFMDTLDRLERTGNYEAAVELADKGLEAFKLFIDTAIDDMRATE